MIFLIFHLTSMVQQKKPSICHERAGFNQPCLGYVLIFKSRVEAAKDSSKDCCVPRITLNSQRTKPTQKLKHANKQMQPLKHFLGGWDVQFSLFGRFFCLRGLSTSLFGCFEDEVIPRSWVLVAPNIWTHNRYQMGIFSKFWGGSLMDKNQVGLTHSNS